MKTTMSRRDIIKLMGFGTMSLAALPLTGSLCNNVYDKKKTGTNIDSKEVNNEMIKRIVPSSSEILPVIGLGSWLQFDVNKEIDLAPLREVLKKMAEYGGKVIDSSPMYGRSEEVIGNLNAELDLEDKFFYATKVWTTGRENGIEQMNASAKKMRRNTIDLMQIHNLVDWQTHFKTLKEWKEKGKVRYIGITHYTASAHDQLEEIVKLKDIDFVQFNYSIGVRNAEDRLLNAANDNGVAVIINEPYESGALFKVVKGKTLPEWSKESDINSWGQFFLKYIISHPAVTCVIPGTSDPKHLVDNMEGGYGQLPDEKMRKTMVEYFEGL